MIPIPTFQLPRNLPPRTALALFELLSGFIEPDLEWTGSELFAVGVELGRTVVVRVGLGNSRPTRVRSQRRAVFVGVQ